MANNVNKNSSNIMEKDFSEIAYSEVQQQYEYDSMYYNKAKKSDNHEISSDDEADHQKQEINDDKVEENDRRSTAVYQQQAEVIEEPVVQEYLENDIYVQDVLPEVNAELVKTPEPNIYVDSVKCSDIKSPKVKHLTIQRIVKPAKRRSNSAAKKYQAPNLSYTVEKLVVNHERAVSGKQIKLEASQELLDFYPSGHYENQAEALVIGTTDQILKGIEAKFGNQKTESNLDSLTQLYRQMRGQIMSETDLTKEPDQQFSSLAFALSHPQANAIVSQKTARVYQELMLEEAQKATGQGRFNALQQRKLPKYGAVDLKKSLEKTQRYTRYEPDHSSDPKYSVQTPYDNIRSDERYATYKELLEDKDQKEGSPKVVNIQNTLDTVNQQFHQERRKADELYSLQLKRSEARLHETIPDRPIRPLAQSIDGSFNHSQRIRMIDTAVNAFEVRRKQLNTMIAHPIGQERYHYVSEHLDQYKQILLSNRETLSDMRITKNEKNIPISENAQLLLVNDDMLMSKISLPPKVTLGLSVQEAEQRAKMRAFFFDQMKSHALKLQKAMNE